jgi:hypothetical protein
MPRTPNAGVLFKALWQIWPKKTSPESSRKAIEVMLKIEDDIDHDRLVKCARAYILKQDQRYTHELGNWIRNNVWKDYYSSDLDSIIEKESALANTARSVLEKWNQVRKKWWLEVADELGAFESVKTKLQERFFEENWEKALDDLSVLFRRKQDGRWRSTVPSLRWFLQGDNCARIIEGEFGVVEKLNRPKPKKIYSLSNPEGYEPPDENFIADIRSQIAEFKKKLLEDNGDDKASNAKRSKDGTSKDDSNGVPEFF